MNNTTVSVARASIIKGYTKSLTNILPMKWVILAIILASLVLFTGKSTRFFMAAVAHNLLFLQIYVMWKQLTFKQWVYSAISIMFAMFLLVSAGTLVNIFQTTWLLIAAIVVVLFFFLIKSVRYIYTIICQDLHPWIVRSLKAPKSKKWVFATLSALLTLFIFAGFFTPGSSHAPGALLKLVVLFVFMMLVTVVYLLLISATFAFPLVVVTAGLSMFLLSKCETDAEQKPKANSFIQNQENNSFAQKANPIIS